ncbi:hypothetical protein KFK14_00195 [Sphingobium phenoxybenzoativorans]|uniref:Uncharacterized protein n=1 Tax=Sphingobium phenoxybenzoativorans TaxID=1592790 RepID=A0A975K7L7_9SPHN|nr:hypothetical protein [Sphingobium phenoxybenzoativorans]QUT05972.1 hypothetical protein KFK14_00195 [Sphingobium phenoxybenzoativorans]
MTTIYYASDAEIETLCAGFTDLTLPKEAWTHAAHFAGAIWLLRCRPDMVAERDMPGMIRRYNESVGGVNSDTSGYHETITLASIRAARAFLAAETAPRTLHESHAALMAGPCGDKDWLLAYWSHGRLMSAEARRTWVEPDVAPFPF